jgi:hypothetical protein
MAVRSVEREMSSIWLSARSIIEPNRERLGNSSNSAKSSKSTKRYEDYGDERNPHWKY